MSTTAATEWTVQADDPIDEPHVIRLSTAMGHVRTDGSLAVDLELHLSHGVGILTTKEARALAQQLIEAAGFADHCRMQEVS